MEKYRRLIFTGLIIISLGITTSTTSGEKFGSLGTVLIAVGSLFFIAGMSQKRKQDDEKEK